MIALAVNGAGLLPRTVHARPGPAAVANGAPPGQLAQAGDEAERARRRAAALDRQARAATLAGERALIAAAALGARVQRAEAALARADAQLAVLARRRAALGRRLAVERAPAARLVAGLQTNSRRPALLALLQPGGIDDAVHLRAILAAVAPQIEARTAALRATLARARELERAALAAAARRRSLQSALLDQRTQLASLAAAERLKAQRAATAAGREAERALAIAERARSLPALEAQLAADTRARRSPPGSVAPRPAAVAGQSGPPLYRLPVAGETAPSPRRGARGLAVLVRPGALAVAPAGGRVAFAGPYRGYGEIVIVEHPGGWTSLVTGLARTHVTVGQTVVPGFPIGQAPARASRIGVELRRNGERVNPLDQLQ